MLALNETHDPALRSWVESANLPAPTSRSRTCRSPCSAAPAATKRFAAAWRSATRSSTSALAAQCGALAPDARPHAPAACGEASLNALHGAGAGGVVGAAAGAVAARCAPMRAGADRLAGLPGAAGGRRIHACRRGSATTPTSTPRIHHATNIGKLFRPDNPLLPNYKWVPIGYHGRARRSPCRARRLPARAARPCRPVRPRPTFGPCSGSTTNWNWASSSAPAMRCGEPVSHRRGRGARVRPVPAQRLVGARHPGLGIPAARPVPGEELRHHDLAVDRHAGSAGAVPRAVRSRPAGDPAPLPYLDVGRQPRARRLRHPARGAGCETASMRAAGAGSCALSATSYRHAYWTVAQMLAHHTVNGCNLQPGDLLGSGTLSGPTLDQAGALIELTAGGKQSDCAARRREPRVPGRRRRRHPARLVRAAGLRAHRLRRMPRHGAAGPRCAGQLTRALSRQPVSGCGRASSAPP